MIPEIQAISAWGLSVLKGVFPPLKNHGFTRGLRGRRGRTKVEQDKAGSLDPASPHRPATPTGDYGYVKRVPGIQRERSGQKPGVSRLFPADFQANQAEDSGISSVCGHRQMPGS